MLNQKVIEKYIKIEKLYYIKINDVYKIGIAIHEKYKSVEDTIIKYRYTKSLLKKENTLKIIDYTLFNDGVQAWDLEKEILKQNKKEKYIGKNFITPKGNSGGESECFIRDIYKNIKYYFIK